MAKTAQRAACTSCAGRTQTRRPGAAQQGPTVGGQGSALSATHAAPRLARLSASSRAQRGGGARNPPPHPQHLPPHPPTHTPPSHPTSTSSGRLPTNRERVWSKSTAPLAALGAARSTRKWCPSNCSVRARAGRGVGVVVAWCTARAVRLGPSQLMFMGGKRARAGHSARWDARAACARQRVGHAQRPVLGARIAGRSQTD